MHMKQIKLILPGLILALILLSGCRQAASSPPESALPTDANTLTSAETKAPPEYPSGEAMEPYMGVYAYSVTIPGENLSPSTEKVGCFYVTDSVAGVSILGIGDLEFSRADASPETAAESWQAVLRDNSLTYLSEDGGSVSLTWNETRDSIVFELLTTDHSVIGGTAYLVRPVYKIPVIENREPLQRPDPEQIKPYLGTYFYDGYYDEEGAYLQRYGYITVSNCDDTMKLEYAGALAIGRTGIAWSSVLGNTQISYSSDYSTDTVNLKWDCDNGELIFMIYDNSTGSAVATGTATRIDALGS